jgi:hypothetical protein
MGTPSSKRRYKRYKRRVEVEFTTGDTTYKGISSDLSEKGLFIRTRYAMVPGTEVSIKLYLPNGNVAHVKGIVRHSLKTSFNFVKNGMGIELVEIDRNYENFLYEELIDYDRKEQIGAESLQKEAPEYIIISCPSCSVKNRVRKDRLSMSPKCGKCGTLLN